MRRCGRSFFWGLVLGSLIYPATDLTLKLTFGRAVLHPDH